MATENVDLFAYHLNNIANEARKERANLLESQIPRFISDIHEKCLSFAKRGRKEITIDFDSFTDVIYYKDVWDKSTNKPTSFASKLASHLVGEGFYAKVIEDKIVVAWDTDFYKDNNE